MNLHLNLSLIPVYWSVLVGVCLTLGGLLLMAWVSNREQRGNLVFSIAAMATAATAFGELAMMQAQTTAQFADAMRWTHVPICIVIVGTVCFVRLHLQAGRLWLAWTVCLLRSVSLLINFMVGENLNYLEVTHLLRVPFLGEEVSIAQGTINPLVLVGQSALLLFIVFVVDATISVWKRGDRWLACRVGGSILFLGVAGTALPIAIFWVGMQWPVIPSLFFLPVILVMSHEMSREIVAAAKRARELEQSRKSLRESEERLAEATAGAGVGIWEWEVDSSAVWGSGQFRSLFGIAPTESIDFNRVLSTVHPDDRRILTDALTPLLASGGSYESEYRVVLPDNRIRWIAARGQMNVDATGKAVLMRGVSFDISERKQSEERFQKVVGAAPYGMILLDGRGTITYANPQIEAYFGYSSEELGGQAIALLIPERFRSAHAAHVDHVTGDASGSTWMGREVFGRRKDGSELPLYVALNAIPGPDGKQILATVIDFSERKKREDLLWQQKRFLWQVIDINPSLIFAKDFQGRFILANKALADLYGTTVRNMIGKTDADFNLNAEEVEAFGRADREVLGTAQEQFIEEERVTDSAGRSHWMQTIKRPIHEKDGTVSAVLGVSTDISARKRTEMEIERQRNELAHLSRVTMLSELSGSLAHELNQPLAAILSNAQAALRFMEQDAPNLDEVRDILRDIVEDDRRAGGVIQGLRLLLKKGEMRREPVDLNDTVRSVLRLVRSDTLNADVSVSVELAADLPRISGDRVQLQQVLLNLVVNACEAMSGEAVPDRQLLVTTALDADGFVRACVTDRGRGVATEDLERVFEPFVTSKAEGLGLGLAVCRQLISAHGGRLWATRNAGRGTRFCFKLPACPGEHS